MSQPPFAIRKTPELTWTSLQTFSVTQKRLSLALAISTQGHGGTDEESLGGGWPQERFAECGPEHVSARTNSRPDEAFVTSTPSASAALSITPSKPRSMLHEVLMNSTDSLVHALTPCSSLSPYVGTRLSRYTASRLLYQCLFLGRSKFAASTITPTASPRSHSGIL